MNSARPTFPWEKDYKSDNKESKSETKLDLFQTIRSTTSDLVNNSTDILSIDQDAINKFAQEFDFNKLEKITARMFPLNFTNERAEINFLCVLNLLNFGSGYRKELHNTNDRGAYESIAFGVMGLYISGEINADTMCKLGLMDIAGIFNLKIREDYELQPGIYTDRPTKLFKLAEDILNVLNQSGAMLRNLQCEDFADFILKTPKITVVDDDSNKTRPRASELITRLAKFFPAFNDHYVINNNTVYVYKKVQLLIYDLYRRFASTNNNFNFMDIDNLTVMADNVLPAVLTGLGILKLNDKLKNTINNNEDLTDKRSEAVLRSACIVAGDNIVALINKRENDKAASDSNYKPNKINAAELDYYFWQTLGKTEQFRKLPRHATKDTIYY